MINVHDEVLSHPDYFKQISVNDLLFVHYKCPQKEHIVRLSTHCNNLIYSLDGERHLIRDDAKWVLSKDVSVFMKPSAYCQEWYQQKDWLVICFFIPDDYLRRLLDEYRNILPTASFSAVSNECMINVQVNEITKAFYYSMLPYFTQDPTPPKGLLEMKFKELFLNILSNPANAPLVGYINQLGQYDKPYLPDIMESNYMYNLSLEEFARLGNRSLAAFKRDFQKHYAISPGKWLLQKRVERARVLLKTTTAGIFDIALDSGFESLGHFSRVYKEKFGHSPSRSRDLAQGD